MTNLQPILPAVSEASSHQRRFSKIAASCDPTLSSSRLWVVSADVTSHQGRILGSFMYALREEGNVLFRAHNSNSMVFAERAFCSASGDSLYGCGKVVWSIVCAVTPGELNLCAWRCIHRQVESSSAYRNFCTSRRLGPIPGLCSNDHLLSAAPVPLIRGNDSVLCCPEYVSLSQSAISQTPEFFAV